MFTGLIQHVGRVAAACGVGDGVRLEIDPCGWSHTPEVGSSIAVNGVCLTILGSGDVQPWCFDVVAQTISKTTVSTWSAGMEVNLESAALLSTPMGGHFVQGHVDGVGVVSEIDAGDRSATMSITLSDSLKAYVFDQGSIAIDGVSLTVAGVTEEGLEVALIPETLKMTTLSQRRVGDGVHVETDMLTRAVVETTQRIHAASETSMP
jgi:riboflavin synthase